MELQHKHNKNRSDIQCPAWRTCSDSVFDCGVGFFYNHLGQFVNDGGAMVLHGGYGGLNGGFSAFCHGLPSTANNTTRIPTQNGE